MDIFKSDNTEDETQHIAAIVQFANDHQWLNAQELYRLCYNIMTEKSFKRALQLAVEKELIAINVKDGVRGISPKPGTLP